MPEAIVYCDQCGRMIPAANIKSGEAIITPTDAVCPACLAALSPEQRSMLEEFADALVPLDGVLAAAALKTGPEYWAPDGVHPTPAGHALIATEWLKAVTGKSFV